MRKYLIIFSFFISNLVNGANRYWVGNSLSLWSLTINWSSTSGGPGGSSIPTPADDVFFDSGGVSPCTIDINASCRSLTLAPTYVSVITQMGSLTIGTSLAGGNSSWSGGSFIGGNSNIINYGTFTLSGAVFTSTRGLLSIGKDFSFTSGMFNHNGGTVAFDQSLSTSAINVSNAIPLTFKNVVATPYYAITTFNNSPSIAGNLTLNIIGAPASQTLLFSQSITVNGNLSIITNASGNQTISFPLTTTSLTVAGNINVSGGGSFFLNTGTVNANSDITYSNTGNAAGGSGTLNISGTGTQTLTGSGTFNQGNLPKVSINSAGTLNLASYITCTNGWTLNTGTINAGTSTLCFYNLGSAFNVTGVMSLNDVVFYGSFSPFIINNDLTTNNLTFDSNTNGFTATIISSITANGNFDMKGSSYIYTNAGALNLKGDINNTNVSLLSSGTGTININGSGNQIITGTLGIDQGAYPFFKIDKPSGTLSLSGYLTFTHGFTWIKGTVDPGSSTCVFNNTAASPQSITADAGGMSFYNLTFEQPDYLRTRLNTNISVLGSFRIAAASGVQTNNHNVTIAGDFTSLNTTAGGGNYAFNAGTGTVTFNGTGLQTITMNNPASGQFLAIFYNVIVDNSAGRATFDDITLTDRLTVTNSVTFTNGRMLTSPTQILYLKSTAVTNTGNASSYVNGPMSQDAAFVGPRNLNFPVGDGGNWRNVILRVSHDATTQYTYTIQTIKSSAVALGYTLPATIHNVSDVRYTTVDRVLTSTGVPSNANLTGTQEITLRYGDDDYVTDFPNLTIANSTGAVSPWLDIGGNATANTAGIVTSTSLPTALTSIGRIFCIANKTGGGNPLPIKLISFDAAHQDGKVLLTWRTATEINNDHFEVARSKDGKEWEFLKSVKAAGTSNERHNYATEDPAPFSGAAYYRLTQVDTDGKTERFVTFVKGPSISMKVYPNPADYQLTIEGEEITINDIKILNMVGIDMTPFINLTQPTNTKVLIDISDLPQQPYILRTKNVSEIIIKK